MILNLCCGTADSLEIHFIIRINDLLFHELKFSLKNRSLATVPPSAIILFIIFF